jgi:hypothetical protein
VSETINIEGLTVSGFRAFLQEQTISLARGGKPISLAVFAPNAKGKSSIVDAMEFFFSEDGTLEKLGQRRSGTKAGPDALAHVLAKSVGVEVKVSLAFYGESGQFSGTRYAGREDEPPPGAVATVMARRKVDFIIRGHELRRFVEDQTPLDRYRGVSEWFGLGSLAGVPEAIRRLRLELETRTAKQSARGEREKDVARITEGEHAAWDRAVLVKWVNQSVLHPLDPALSVQELSHADSSYKTVVERREREDERAGIKSLDQVISATKAVYEVIEVRGKGEAEAADAEGASQRELGRLVEFEEAAKGLAAAEAAEREEKAKSQEAVFEEVWAAAESVLQDGSVALSACPVCDTPFAETTARTREGVEQGILVKLRTVRAYKQARQRTVDGQELAIRAKSALEASVKGLSASYAAAGMTAGKAEREAYAATLADWQAGVAAPPSVEVKAVLQAAVQKAEGERADVARARAAPSYAGAQDKIDRLLALGTELERMDAVAEEECKLLELVRAVEQHAAEEVRGHTQTVVDALRDVVKRLYEGVNESEGRTPEVHLEIAGDTKQPELNLLVDFADNRQGVVPSGYLSDSQLHTLALSLKLAAIKVLNEEVPIVVLDDIVTSYDADHRRSLAKILVKELEGFQVILLTHDERFFTYIKECAPGASWAFRRITRLRLDSGPEFHDHKVPDEHIDNKLGGGESAANEIRQAEEEWLQRICRDFRVQVEMRTIERPYDYERGELAIALHRFLKDKGISPPAVAGVRNPFLVSLQQGNVENFGSHFQPNPSASDSVGDEKTRWREFKEFRDLFKCPECGRVRFKRPRDLKGPVCAHKGCETPFTFSCQLEGSGDEGSDDGA